MRYSIYILSLALLLSCNRKKDSKVKDKAPVIVYSIEEYFEKAPKNKNVVIVDTMCTYETQRAITDINRDVLSIHRTFLYWKNYFPKYPDMKLLGRHLAKYNIAVDTSFSDYNSGCSPVKGFERLCYQTKMKNEIEKRYGHHFLDSLCRVVDKEYVVNHPNDLYDMGKCDQSSIYPDKKKFQSYFDEAEDFFEQHFEYPSGYQFKNEESYSYTEVDFILDKKGKISKLKVSARFQNEANEVYRTYFENSVRQFISQTKWLPAKSSGIIVKSKFRTAFYHK